MNLITIGELSARSGLPVSKIRYYEQQGLLQSIRSKGGNRLFTRADNRRLGFIAIAQNFGYSLDAIKSMLAALPEGRTPNAKDWEKISQKFLVDIDARINKLETMRDKLAGCIGCGCLSMEKCKLYNPDDIAAQKGQGAIYVLQKGD